MSVVVRMKEKTVDSEAESRLLTAGVYFPSFPFTEQEASGGSPPSFPGRCGSLLLLRDQLLSLFDGAKRFKTPLDVI